MTTRTVLYALAAIMVFGVAGWTIVSSRGGDPKDLDLASLSLPDLTPEQEAGRVLFNANCAVCHGENTVGSDKGPPLVHRIYEPNHHGDMAFVLAARQGVRAHHWRFGDMPAVEAVNQEEVLKITAYVRALQRANGIN